MLVDKNRWFKKGIAKQRPERNPTPAIERKLRCQSVRFSGFLQSKDEPYQLLGSMRDGDIVMLALGPFLGEVGGKGWIPAANILCSIKYGIPQVS